MATSVKRLSISVYITVLLLMISLTTALFYANNFSTNTTLFHSTDDKSLSVVLSSHCEAMVNRKRPPTTHLRTPPWIHLLNDTDFNLTKLYIHADKPWKRRLGNQLFNYASLFGIAWRNNRIPLWPDGKTLLDTAFSISIPIDRNNAIIKVSKSHFR